MEVENSQVLRNELPEQAQDAGIPPGFLTTLGAQEEGHHEDKKRRS